MAIMASFSGTMAPSGWKILMPTEALRMISPRTRSRDRLSCSSFSASLRLCSSRSLCSLALSMGEILLAMLSKSSQQYGYVSRLLVRWCFAVLVFDGDEAGQSAADRALEFFLASELDLRVLACR